ncbi:MAG: 2-polyprenylphenol 6-hydroxylase [Pseudomonadota bacterium]
MWKAPIHLWRLLKAGATLIAFNVVLPPEYFPNRPWPLRMLAGLGKKRGGRPLEERLSEALQALGPSYVKLGQFLATRPDIVGPQIAQSLERLHDEMPAFDQATARNRIEASLNKPVGSLFEQFNAPVAAASLAQVHKAQVPSETADDPPRPVAVKVMRPGVADAFTRDIDTFMWTAQLAERLRPQTRRLEPVRLVETLARSASLELDLRLEAAAADEIASQFPHKDEFIVPRIDWERTSKHVLTCDWIDGIRISDLQSLDSAGYDRQYLANLIIRIFLVQALEHGFFHADMHPGNLFVVPGLDAADNDETGKRGRIAAVDFGIMGRLDKDTRRFMAEILFGFLTQDYIRVAQVHFEAGYVPPKHSLEEFAQALRAIGAPLIGRGANQISMARVLAQLFETTRTFDMHLQPQLVLLQKTMVVVEGVARILDPEVNMWESARPVVEAWMNRTIGIEGRLGEAAESAQAVRRLLVRLPQIADGLDQLTRLQQDDLITNRPSRLFGSDPVRASRRGIVVGALLTGIAALIASSL